MKIVVDFDVCASNGVCMSVAPDLFEIRADNYLYVLDENPGEDKRGELVNAVNSCPTGAISIVED